MTTWATFKAHLRLQLGDTDPAAFDYTDPELLVYVNFALTAISEHTAQSKNFTFTVVTGIKTLALPADYIALGPVRSFWNNIEEVLRPSRREPGQTYYDLANIVNIRPETYYEWPTGTLNFRVTVPVGAEMRVSYWAYWTPLAADGDLLGVWAWMEEALTWHCLGQAMAKPGLQTSRLRQYLTRRDSGSPEDNPLLEYANYCRKQYERILVNRPQQDRSGWETAG